VTKNAYFLEKNCKKRRSVGGSASEPPSVFLRWLGALPTDLCVATTACCCSTSSVYST